MTNISRIIFIALVLLWGTNNLYAQKCKYKHRVIDPMTEELALRTQVKVRNFFVVSFYKKGDDHRVELNVRFVGERNFVVAEGELLSLKLPSKKILKFKCAKNANPVSYVVENQVYTSYAMSYFCTKEQLSEIAEAGFIVAQAKLGSDEITYEVKEQHIKKTGIKARCILEG